MIKLNMLICMPCFANWFLTAKHAFLCQFVLLGAVPFPSDIYRLKELGVGGVVTMNEPYETLVSSSLYEVSAHIVAYLA